MTKKEKRIVGFDFREIPLDEARNAVIAGDGNYSGIIAKLLEALPALPGDKAFVFGLPGGREVDEKQQRGICMAINASLRRARLKWRVTYSSMKKVFLCLPMEPNLIAGQTKGGNVPISASNNFTDADQKIIKLRREGLSVRAICEMLPEIPQAHIKYFCYQVMAGEKPAGPRPEDLGRVKAFIDICREVFKTSDFRSRALRKAVCVVGVNTLGLKSKSLAPYLGLTKSGVYFTAKKKSDMGTMEIQKLTEAVKGGKHV